MSEVYRTDEEAAAISGQVLAGGVKVGQYNAEAMWPPLARFIERVARALAPLCACEVYKDDADSLTIGVRAGSLWSGAAIVAYAGGTSAVVDDAVNYVYLEDDGTLVVVQDAFPDPAVTPHFPLAIVSAGSESATAVSGQFAIDDIEDVRSRMMLTIVQAPA